VIYNINEIFFGGSNMCFFHITREHGSHLFFQHGRKIILNKFPEKSRVLEIKVFELFSKTGLYSESKSGKMKLKSIIALRTVYDKWNYFTINFWNNKGMAIFEPSRFVPDSIKNMCEWKNR
jgi:hypothetical protein